MSELQEAATPAIPEAVVAEVSTPEDTMSGIYDKFYPTERVNRADDGKFVSKNPEKLAEGAVEAEPAEEITQEPAEAPLEPVKVIEPPKSWSAEKKALWASVSPEAQEYIAQREAESQKGHSQLGEKASRADKYESVISRYKHVLDSAPEQEIESLLATKAAFRQDARGTFERLAQQLGIDLSQYAKQPSEGAPAETDQIRSLMQEVQGLKRQLGETHQRLTAREQQEMQSREQSLASLVDEFKSGKDYWGEIENQVLAQIHALKIENPNADPKTLLQEAHDRAVKLNDEVSNRLTKAKRDKEAADKAAEDKRKADQAKRLASLNTKSTTGQTPKAAKNIDAELEEIYDKVSARG
jgi:hypothetical protein